jgi:molybdenum cofactor biosynthesis enzyme MoaA
MRNLIMELQIFKDDNEKIKKAQEDQHEINEVLLRNIKTKKIPKIMKWMRKLVKNPQRIIDMEQKRKQLF